MSGSAFDNSRIGRRFLGSFFARSRPIADGARPCETCIVQWLKIAFLLALAGEVSAESAPQRETLMDQIERAVVLPKGTKPLSSYGQNYAFIGNDQVKAVYFVPEPLLTENSGCVHGDLKPCSKDEIRRMVSENARRRAAYASAGERRWFVDQRELPIIADDGCNQITIRYDIAVNRVLSVACNGRG